MTDFIILDTEFTTWEGCIHNGWKNGQEKEITQIAAIRVNPETLEVVDELSILVKPTINPVVSDYFINLTGITNEMLQEKGVSLKQAYDELVAFCGDLTCYSHDWNGADDSLSDGKIIEDNLKLVGLTPTSNLNYKNIASWFKQKYKANNINVQKQCSGEIAALLGREKNLEKMELGAHNALYDVYSLLEGIKYFGGLK